MCCVYCSEQWLCALATEGTVSVCCGYCKEQWLCAVVTVGNIGYVLWVL